MVNTSSHIFEEYIIKRSVMGLTSNGASSTNLSQLSLQHAILGESGAPPAVIMAEVLQTFKRLNVCWKKIGHYTMKCKWLPNFPSYPQPAIDTTLRMNSFFMSAPANTVANVTGRVSDAAVKFEMQLFKTLDEKYLLDLQRVNGSPFLFLQICSEFMAHLLIT
ncbi:hypothetical protein ACLOJK_000332 [Asimina triloba]